MTRNLDRMQRVMMCLGVACLGILPLGPLSAQEPKLRATLGEQTPPKTPEKPTKGHRADVRSVAFSPDGKTLASGSADYTIKLWDVATGKEQATLIGHTDYVPSVAYSPDGKTLASAGRNGQLKLWDVQTGKERASVNSSTEGGMFSVAYSPDGKTLVSGNEIGSITLWDVKTGKELRSLLRHKDNNPFRGVFSALYSPDGKTLASGSAQGTIILRDLLTDKEAVLKEHAPAPVESVAFSPDGKTLASGSADRTIKLWDVQTGKERITLKGHTWYVASVAFSPDGKTLASGSADKTIKLWDVQTGKELATLNGHTDFVWSVAFSPDGKILASGSADRTIKLWNVPPAKKADKALPPIQQNEAAGKKIDDRQRIVGAWRFAKMQADGVDTPFQAFKVTFTGGGECIMSMIEEFAGANPVGEQYLPFSIRYRLVWPGEIETPAPLLGGMKDGTGIYKFEGDDRLIICFGHGDKKPTEFTTVKDSGRMLWFLDRVKPGDAKPTLAEIAEYREVVARVKKAAQEPKQQAPLKSEEDDAVRAIEKLRGSADRNAEASGKPVIHVCLTNATWVTDADLKPLKEFKKLQTLSLSRCFKVTDAGLKEIKDHKCLYQLFLCQTQVTDAGLKELKGLLELRALSLSGIQVTAAGMKELKELKSLEYLDLSYSKVTDAWVQELKELKGLKTLMIVNCPVTDAGFKELTAALPKCQVIR